jgi:uncharacterized protein YxeA
MNKNILNSLVFILVLLIGGGVAFFLKQRHDADAQAQAYVETLKAMKQTGQDEHSTDYMKPKK